MTQSTVQSEHFNSQQQSHSHLGSVQNNKAANSERRIRLSTSENFFNKENLALERNGSQKWAYARGFVQQEWTLNEIESHIVKGKAILVAVCHKNYRKTKNFISSQIIGVDIDEGNHNITELVTDVFIQKHAALIYATPSSTPENPRWRILFILDEPITDPKKYKDLVIRLNGKLVSYNVDPACKDAVRLFYGSKTDNYIVLPDNVLPVELINTFPLPENPSKKKKLDRQSNKINQQNKPAAKTPLPQFQSEKQFTEDAGFGNETDVSFSHLRFSEYIRTVKTRLFELQPELAEGKHVKCPNPQHTDNHPSFRISYEVDKVSGIPHCSCGTESAKSWKKVGEWIGLHYGNISNDKTVPYTPLTLSKGSLDNHLREYLLENEHGNMARLWDILLYIGWRAGHRFAETDILKSTKDFHIAKTTIRKILNTSLQYTNENGTVEELSLFRLDNTDCAGTTEANTQDEAVKSIDKVDDMNYVSVCPDNCLAVSFVFSAALEEKSNRDINRTSANNDNDIKKKRGRPSSRYYVMPDQIDVMTFLGIQPLGISDEVTNNDLQSVEKYRSTLNDKLIERKSGVYANKLLADRLGVSKRTLNRYERKSATLIKTRRMRLSVITSANVKDLLDGKDKQYWSDNHAFLIGNDGVKHSPSSYWGKTLISQNREPVLVSYLASHRQSKNSQQVMPLIGPDGEPQIKISRMDSNKGGVPEEILLHKIYEYVSNYNTGEHLRK